MITSQKLTPWLNSLILGLVVLVIASSTVFLSLFNNRIYPSIKIDHMPVGGLTPIEAKRLLKLNSLTQADQVEFNVSVGVDNLKISSSSAQLRLHRELQPAINQAYELGRVGWPINRIWTLITTTTQPYEFTTSLAYDHSQVQQLIQELKAQVDLVGQNPSAELGHSGLISSLQIHPGQPGRELQVEDTAEAVLSQVGPTDLIEAVIASTSTVLDSQQQNQARERASYLVGKRLILKAKDVRLDLNDQKLISLLAFPDGFNRQTLDSLLDAWSDTISRPAQNAEFDYESETMTVTHFKPDRPGLELNRAQTQELLTSEIEKIINQQSQGQIVGIGQQTNITQELPITTTQPAITLEQTNDLGINKLIGLGESEYGHSIPNRVYNVALTTQKINNILVPPGKEFFFNQTLGEVSSRTGFRSAYVIKNNRTELGDGGGVCQVSTTLFRAILDAGLQITRRLPHSYRVSYYELNSKPGIDATIYAGDTDLRFINDTNHLLLIHGETNNEDLYMKIEIYGTSDGRTTEIKDHEVWGYVPPPPPEYYPDPSLPTGVKKQIDWAVAGVRAKFTHVIKNAEGEVTHEQTYYSNYRPWAAKYLVGE